MILSSIETVRRKKLNPALKVEGIILTMADPRTLMTGEVTAAIKQQFGATIPIFEPPVRRSVRFAESVVAGRSILAYEPTSQGAEAYRQIARALMGRK